MLQKPQRLKYVHGEFFLGDKPTSELTHSVSETWSVSFVRNDLVGAFANTCKVHDCLWKVFSTVSVTVQI